MQNKADFIETIRIVDGRFYLLPFHKDRMSATCAEVYGCNAPELIFADDAVPGNLRRGLVKCRVRYGREIESVEFERYVPRYIGSLRAVQADDLDYHLKYADRTNLDIVRERRAGADEVVIIKEGLATDTSYSNLLFRAGNKLLTPSRPLLNGVMRRWLLKIGVAEECEITEDMLKPGNRYGITEVLLINAMLPPGTIPPIPLEQFLRK